MSERYKPHVEHTHIVKTHSSRNGAEFKLITMHSTQGANIPHSIKDLVGLGNYFDSTLGKRTASSSTVAVDSDGNSARFVKDSDKAWHCAFYNPWSLGIELVGFAERNEWTNAQIDEAARWIAYWNYHHQIPIRKASVTKDGRITKSGVIRHSELGNLGGGHSDPGSFPLAKCHERARRFRRMY